jgi:hypothetical protein
VPEEEETVRHAAEHTRPFARRLAVWLSTER